MSEESSDVTTLLVGLSSVEEAALGQLLPIVYDELRRIAHNQLRGERVDHPLRTTEPVHEAYEKLVERHRWDVGTAAFLVVIAAAATLLVQQYNQAQRSAERARQQAERISERSFTVRLPDERSTRLGSAFLVAVRKSMDRSEQSLKHRLR